MRKWSLFDSLRHGNYSAEQGTPNKVLILNERIKCLTLFCIDLAVEMMRRIDSRWPSKR
jgi:hypothetical protein